MQVERNGYYYPMDTLTDKQVKEAILHGMQESILELDLSNTERRAFKLLPTPTVDDLQDLIFRERAFPPTIQEYSQIAGFTDDQQLAFAQTFDSAKLWIKTLIICEPGKMHSMILDEVIGRVYVFNWNEEPNLTVYKRSDN